MRLSFIILVIVTCLLSFPTLADIVGRASVVDGDTLEIHAQRIRLHGIDAPESAQLCTIGGKPYRCGQRAALALADHIGARTVRCEERDVDRYQRVVAVCSVAGEDLGAWMVRQAWALAFRRYSLDYLDDEREAREARRGMWAGEFTTPWEWRAKHSSGRLK